MEEDKCVWVLMPQGEVPERWTQRAQPMSLVPLVPTEAEQLLEKGAAIPKLSLEEEGIARLVARGLTAEEIAVELHMTERSVYRRIARLRTMLGVQTRSELAAVLARHGF